ncbi:MAG: hypothetical protein QM703_27050 [Gemmatales bacterium]
MTDAKTFLERVLHTGLLSAVSTTVVAAICGKMQNNNSVEPINAVSHIAWGDKAAHQPQASLQYTATGLFLNGAAVTSWAALHELLEEQTNQDGNFAKALADGALVSALAFVTDYFIVPKRLTPGFEKRLSNRSLFAIYTALAISLGCGRALQK